MTDREQTACGLFNSNYNCAQSVFGAFCDEFGLDDTTALKIASGFGGGIRQGEVCGAVSGAVMAIGLKCGYNGRNGLNHKLYCNEKTVEFTRHFIWENGSVLCRDLLDSDIRSPEDLKDTAVGEKIEMSCPAFVASAVRILEKMDFED